MEMTLVGAAIVLALGLVAYLSYLYVTIEVGRDGNHEVWERLPERNTGPKQSRATADP